jgi:hypothetical protein
MNNEYISKALTTLKELGATEIVIYFDGSGDSGSIDSVQIRQSDGKVVPNLDDLFVNYPVEKSQYINGEWFNDVEIKQIPIFDALEKYTYDELERTNVDWYNNDGGFGELRIELSDDVSIELEVNQRYTEYTTYSFSLSEE